MGELMNEDTLEVRLAPDDELRALDNDEILVGKSHANRPPWNVAPRWSRFDEIGLGRGDDHLDRIGSFQTQILGHSVPCLLGEIEEVEGEFLFFRSKSEGEDPLFDPIPPFGVNRIGGVHTAKDQDEEDGYEG